MVFDEYEIIISEDALSMLDYHAQFLAKVNQNAAIKLIDQILSDIETLSSLPERCPFYDNPFIPKDRYRMLLSCKRYLIIYEITKNTIFVDYIVDCRQNNENF